MAPDSITVSPDGKRLAFFRKGADGKKWWAVVDDIEGERYDGVGKMQPLFSPDSRRSAYVAVRKGRNLVVLDGVAGKEYDGIGGVTFSPDSKRLAYMAQRGDERFIVVDGAEQSLRFDGMHASGPVFSPDSQHLGYIGKRGGKWLVVVDGKEGKAYESAGGFVFAADNRHWAYFATRDSTAIIVLDGLESREYDGIVRDTRLTFTKDKTVEAFAHRGGEILRVIFTNLSQ